MRIAVDFDGTLVDHRYPDIGAENPYAFQWLKRYQEAGAVLILWTMRSNGELQEAVDYCKARGLVFDGINEGPGDRSWTNSPKVYAKIYIDDAAFGCPLTAGPRSDSRPWVDWVTVGPRVMTQCVK